MVKFKVETNYNGINGLCIIEPVVFKDKRGYLFEAFNEKELSFLNANFVQDNQAYSIDGVLRGFGINKKVPQAKLVRVLRGCIFDVVIDLRKNSRTFMKWSVVEISKDNQKQVFIPEGFAHAYLALEDSEILFKMTTHYNPGDEIGFAWNSKIFDIPWPHKKKIILSDKDKNNPEFDTSMLE